MPRGSLVRANCKGNVCWQSYKTNRTVEIKEMMDFISYHINSEFKLLFCIQGGSFFFSALSFLKIFVVYGRRYPEDVCSIREKICCLEEEDFAIENYRNGSAGWGGGGSVGGGKVETWYENERNVL